MSFLTFTPPVAPVVGSTERREMKLLKTQFGDGYSQTTRDGINHARRIVTLRWEALDLEDALAIDDFLALCGGDQSFIYITPGRTDPMRFTCDDWTMTQTTGGFASIDATFRQSFGIGA